jgi:hypothetical protein
MGKYWKQAGFIPFDNSISARSRLMVFAFLFYRGKRPVIINEFHEKIFQLAGPKAKDLVNEAIDEDFVNMIVLNVPFKNSELQDNFYPNRCKFAVYINISSPSEKVLVDEFDDLYSKL